MILLKCCPRFGAFPLRCRSVSDAARTSAAARGKEHSAGFHLAACLHQAGSCDPRKERTADTRRNLTITPLHFPSLRSISAISRVSRALSSYSLRGQFLYCVRRCRRYYGFLSWFVFAPPALASHQERPRLSGGSYRALRLLIWLLKQTHGPAARTEENRPAEHRTVFFAPPDCLSAPGRL